MLDPRPSRRPLLAAPLVAFALAASAAAQSHVLSDKDGTAILTVREDAALGFVVESLGDDQHPQAILFQATDLWQLEFHRGAQCILIGPSQLSEYDLDVDYKNKKVVAEWDDAKSPLLPGEEFSVEVEFKLKHEHSPGGPEFESKIKVKTKTPASALHRVRFPRLDAVVPGQASSARLAAPIEHGVLLPDPVNNVTLVGPAKINAILPPCDAFALVEPGNLSMQWWSLYNELDPEQAQFYFGTHDNDGYRKEWLVEPAGADLLRVALRHVPEDNHLPDQNYHQPYPFVMKVLRGDWYDGAQHYRDWALEQPWTEQGPMSENPEFSSIMRSTDALGVTQPAGNGADDPATFCPQDPDWSQWQYWPGETTSTQTSLDVDKVTVRVFFWDFSSFLRDIGDWFPIRPEFIAAGNQLRAQGDDYSAYFVSLGYSSRIPSYASSYVPDTVNGGTYGSVEDWGLLNEDQQRVFTTNQVCPVAPQVVPVLSLCQSTQFTADYSSYVARRLYDEAGATGLYLDVVSGTDAQICYDPTHGHPLGGGSYYVDGLEHVFESVRDEMRDDPTNPAPEYFLQSEGAGEYFLPWIDAVQPVLTWSRTVTFCDLFTGQCPRNGTDFLIIPSYSTVYNDFQLTGATLQLNAPRTLLSALGIPILQDPFFMITLREIMFAHVSLGYEPFAGSLVDQDLMGDNANPALFPSYFLMIDGVRRLFDTLELEDVRRFTVEGKRLRDPEVLRAGAADAPLPRFPFDALPINSNWLPYGRLQPVVYGSLHSAEAGSKSTKELDEVGMLLLNWTDASDAFAFGAGNVGDLAVKARFDPAPYAPDATEYSVYLVSASGETLLESGAIAGPIETTVTVPARSGVFLRYEFEGEGCDHGSSCGCDDDGWGGGDDDDDDDDGWGWDDDDHDDCWGDDDDDDDDDD